MGGSVSAQQEEATTFLYILVDPRTNAIRYLGKSSFPKRRVWEHNGDKKSNPHKANWLAELKRAGLKVRLEILEECPVSRWRDREKCWQEHFLERGEPLTNKAQCGYGPANYCFTEEFRQKIYTARDRERAERAAAGVPTAQDYTGARFGRWLVLELVHGRKDKKRGIRWRCRCECGNEHVVRTASLLDGTSRSCGCLLQELRHEIGKKHGACATREYNIWKNLPRESRITSAKRKACANRGVTVCSDWEEFDGFLGDMGPAPSPGHVLARVDKTRPYCKSNCFWATPVEAMRTTNRTQLFELDGVSKTLGQWAKSAGMSRSCLVRRLESSCTFREAVSTPVDPEWRGKHTPKKVWEGFIAPTGDLVPPILDMNAWAREHGLQPSLMRSVYHGREHSHKGWTTGRPEALEALRQKTAQQSPAQQAAANARWADPERRAVAAAFRHSPETIEKMRASAKIARAVREAAKRAARQKDPP